MPAKYIILDFINLIFFLALISFCIIFFTNGGNFKAFGEIIKALAPMAFFIFLFSIKSKLNQRELKKRTSEGNLNITLRLNFTDKITFDVILFLFPIIILLIPFLTGQPDLTDALQALTAFLIFYFWQRHLFKQDSQ